jgi:hypothetical protein
MSAREKVACLIGFGLEAGLVLLAWVERGSEHDVQRDVLLFFVTSVLYLCGLVVLGRVEGEIRGWVLVGWAVVFRLTAFGMGPVFSDDLYRYRWEGQVAAAGWNPYDWRPADAAMTPFFDARVDGKDFKAVYGPLLQTLQWALYELGGGALWVMKLGACAAEAALGWMLWRNVGEKWRWMAWGWCPLGIVEFWGMGHHDAVMMALAVGALLAAEGRRWPWAYLLLGLAGAAKYWPLLLWPLLVRLGGGRWAWVTAAAVGACWWPWRTDVSENVRFLGGFVGGWRNNDLLFGGILALTGDLVTAKRVALGLIGAAAAGAAVWARSLRAGYWAVALTVLVVSANVHPWYLTWIVPLAVFEWPWAVLAWGALAPLHYVVLIRWRAEQEWDGVSNWRWLVYAPVAAVLMVQMVRREVFGKSRS